MTGTIKSAIGLGNLLWMGIGDTIRVSLSADPVEEVRVTSKSPTKGWVISRERLTSSITPQDGSVINSVSLTVAFVMGSAGVSSKKKDLVVTKLALRTRGPPRSPQ